jgi:metal-responsive CopG/Arc/MetJ family transcriptional regulator
MWLLTPATMWIIIAITIHMEGAAMKTIQMTLDDELVERVDKVVKKLHSSRSAFTRDALRDALEKHNALLMEQKHRQGYRKNPVGQNEFSVWEDEQDWGDI